MGANTRPRQKDWNDRDDQDGQDGQDDRMVQQYLVMLRRQLRALPQAERADAVREIASHIAESKAAGNPLSTVLARLGEPRALAQAYLADYYLQDTPAGRAQTLRRALARLGFTLGTGLVNVFVVPLLSVAVLGFGLAAAVSPIFGIIRTFGAHWIVIGSSTGWQVPYGWSLPVLGGLGVICALIAWAAARILRFYLSAVLAGYRRRLPERVTA
jgi:uncharacterized membrane protein